MDSYRPLKPNELEILNKLLEPEFPGRDELLEQLKSVTARKINEHGELELKCNAERAAFVKVCVPTEGEYKDADGVSVHVLLHVTSDGFMNELEIYKDDSSKIINSPLAKNLSLFAPYSEFGVEPISKKLS